MTLKLRGGYQKNNLKEFKPQILEVFKKYIERYGEDKIDFITFSSYFLFCGNYVKDFASFSKSRFYNRWAFKKLEAQGYLEGVKRESLDFKALLEKYEGKDCFLVLDPPYLQTQVGNYKSHFLLKDFLYLCRYIKDKDFVMFSSESSDTIDLFDFLEIPYKLSKASLNLSKSKDLLLW